MPIFLIIFFLLYKEASLIVALNFCTAFFDDVFLINDSLFLCAHSMLIFQKGRLVDKPLYEGSGGPVTGLVKGHELTIGGLHGMSHSQSRGMHDISH